MSAGLGHPGCGLVRLDLLALAGNWGDAPAAEDAAFARLCLCYGAMWPLSSEGIHGMRYDEYLRGDLEIE